MRSEIHHSALGGEIDRERALNTICFFSSIPAVLYATMYAVAIHGFPGQKEHADFKILSITLFIFFFAPTFRKIIPASQRLDHKWYLSTGSLVLYGVFFTILMAVIAHQGGLAALFFQIAGPVMAVYFCGQYLFRYASAKTLLYIAATLVLALWATGTYMFYGDLNLEGRPFLADIIPLASEFTNEHGNYNINYFDNHLYSAGLMNVFTTYGVPGWGLDGVAYLPYHNGSYFVFSLYAKMMALHPFTIYSAIKILYFPALFFVMGVFALEVNRSCPASEYESFVPLGIGILNIASMYDYTLLHGESISFALALFSLSACTMIAYHRERVKKQLGKSENVFIYFALPLLAVAIGYSKVPFTLFLSIFFGYSFFRYGYYRSRHYWWAIILLAIACFGTALAALPPGMMPGSFKKLSWFYFVRKWETQQRWFELFSIAVWPLAYIAFALMKNNIRTAGEFVRAFTKGRTADIEAAILALVFSVIWLPLPMAGMDYIVMIQKYIITLLLISALARVSFTALWRNYFRRPLDQVNVVFLTLITLSLPLWGVPLSHLAVSARKTAFSLLVQKPAILTEHTRIEEALKTVAHPDYQNYLGRLKIKTDLIHVLYHLDKMPEEEKKQTLLFVPQRVSQYWNYFKKCLSTPALVPSIAGLAMLDGMPQSSCHTMVEFDQVRARTMERDNNDYPDRQLCEMCRERKFIKLVKLDYSEGEWRMTKLECR